MQQSSPSGLKGLPQLEWGSHLAHVFRTGDDLRDTFVPYFKAGLENNERCLWVTGSAFTAEQARSALRAALPDLDQREKAKQIEIADGGQWYKAGAKLRPAELVAGLVQREQEALDLGFAGLRTSGNCSWVSPEQWPDFLDYEALVHRTVGGRRMICACSYCVDQLRDDGHLEVMERHNLALSSPGASPQRSPGPRRPRRDPQAESGERGLLEALDRQKRTFDLAMIASDMGTWRYTLADNICVYDENAQRLYGLTEARFLHDEEGVKAKFHPDDLAIMWSRVAKALDPAGDGRYDVEYRVRQPNGDWRWLSAWGLVEFETNDGERKPVAIVGASRDLTKAKQAEELQRLLLNELSHRVKNTLATLQAVTSQTLRTATDLPSAREALVHRIGLLAKAHDLLTARDWTRASLADVVKRALEPFNPAQLTIAGSAVDLSPRQVLALSVVLHELATNAAKYGALSSSRGQVAIEWRTAEDLLHLQWSESGGPPVAPPKRKGFGSRLVEELIVRDLGGSTALDYDPLGVRCTIAVPL